MGGLRDCIIGIEYLNGRAERVHAGGKVVKNVTGYDLCRMMLGSLGGLGVITAANFKVIPDLLNHMAYVVAFGILPGCWELPPCRKHGCRLTGFRRSHQPPPESQDWILGIGISGNPEDKHVWKKSCRASSKIS